MLLSFFTQGVPRVQDQQTKIEIKKIYILTFGMGESTAFMRCQANSGQELSHYWENTCGAGMMVVSVVSSLVAPGALRYLPSLEILSQ